MEKDMNAHASLLRAKRGGDDRDDDANRKRAKLDLTNLKMLPSRIRCPRCFSLNTKFCYFNNHNLGQPRFLCRACRRYWTHGGALRNVPVGGGYRRSRVFSAFRPNTIIIQPQPSGPSQPPTIPEAFSQLPQRVTNMAAMVAGVSGIPSLTTISFLDTPTRNPAFADGIFSLFGEMLITRSREQGQRNPTNPPLLIGGTSGDSGAGGANSPTFAGFQLSTLQTLLDGFDAQAEAQAQGQDQGHAPPPLQIHDQQPAPPPQIDRGGDEGVGNRNKDKQPMYPLDETFVLPGGSDVDNPWTGAENNTNVASTSRPNFWRNYNGASTSTGLTECSFNPNEWPLDDDDDLPNGFLGDRC